MPDRTFNWQAVHEFIAAQKPNHGPIAGTREWCELAADDPAKLAGLFRCASAWVLESELSELQQIRAAKEAAEEVSAARDWAAEGQFQQKRKNAIRSGAYIERKAVC